MEVLWILGLFVAGSALGLLSGFSLKSMMNAHPDDMKRSLKEMLWWAATGTLSTAALIGAGYVWGAM